MNDAIEDHCCTLTLKMDMLEYTTEPVTVEVFRFVVSSIPPPGFRLAINYVKR